MALTRTIRHILLNDSRRRGHRGMDLKTQHKGRRLINLMPILVWCIWRTSEWSVELSHASSSIDGYPARTASTLRQYRYDHRGAIWTNVWVFNYSEIRDNDHEISAGRTWSMHWSILLLRNHDDSVLDCQHCAVSGSGKAILFRCHVPFIDVVQWIRPPSIAIGQVAPMQEGGSTVRLPQNKSSWDSECYATRSLPAQMVTGLHSLSTWHWI